jgi:hypothetical protein
MQQVAEQQPAPQYAGAFKAAATFSPATAAAETGEYATNMTPCAAALLCTRIVPWHLHAAQTQMPAA